MRTHLHLSATLLGILAAASTMDLSARSEGGPVNGTIWVANRGANTVRAIDADTLEPVWTIPMAANSQPGDLAVAKHKVYVAEELGTPPAIAIIDAGTGLLLSRIVLPAGSRPHHVHASQGGNFVAVGLYGTDTVAVVDTHTDSLVGIWDSNRDTTDGRVHAAVFSNDERTLYLASDTTGQIIAMDPLNGTVLWRLAVPAAHEMAVTNNQKLLVVSRRTADRLAIIRLDADPTSSPAGYEDVLSLPRPDTLRFSANEALLTVGLRAVPGPAKLAVVDTRTGQVDFVTLGPPAETTTIGGHQWTSPDGRYTLASYEGGSSPGVAIIDHKAGNRMIGTISYPGRPHGVEHTRP